MFKHNLIDVSDLTKSTLAKTGCNYSYNAETQEIVLNATGTYSQVGAVPNVDTVIDPSTFDVRYIKVYVSEVSRIYVKSKNANLSVMVGLVDSTLTVKQKIYVADAGQNININIADIKWAIIGFYKTSASSGETYSDNVLVTRDGTTTYEAPISQKTTYTPTLRGTPVSSGGNYTDKNNQQWLCDTIEKYADGSGKLIQRVVDYTFDGTEDWQTETNKISLRLSPVSGSSIFKSGIILCSHLQMNNTNNAGDYCYNNIKVIYFNKNSKWETAEQLKTFLATENISCILAKDKPIETPLTALQLSQLNLSTYYPITNISSESGVMVEYICDTKNYIDNKFLQTN